MNERDFCYWLKGWFELNKTIDNLQSVSPGTIKVIEDHLNLVFLKLTPNRSNPDSTFKVELDRYKHLFYLQNPQTTVTC